MRPLFAALVASGLAAPPGIQAATIQVTTGGDAGTGATCTLRQAIVAMNTASLAGTACANSGGAFGTGDLVDLTLQAGTIALAGATEIQIDVPLVINGPGASALTVSGAGASRVFSNNFGPPVLTLDVNNLTVANGKSAGPGGCVLGAGVVRLLNSVVTGCTALHDPNFSAPILNGIGGGIAAYDVRLTNSTVASNTAQSSGGGIFAKYATLDHSRVDNNVVSGQACNITQQTKYCVTAILGGGGVLSFGQVQMIHSTVSGNTVHASPISSDNAGPPPVTTTFNIGFGGGITQIGKYQPGVLSAATAKSTVFGTRSPELRAARRAEAAATRSKALAAGGPRVKADGYGDHILAMQSSTISGNRITGNHANDGKYLGGGAFAYSEYYNAEIANSTISGNSLDAAGEYLIGGALFVDSAEIYNSTITGNNGLAAIAFKYSPSGLAPPVAKSAMGPNAVKAARAAALVASVRDKLAALRGARGKAAVDKASSPPDMVSTIVGGNAADYDISCSGPGCTISGSNNLVQTVDSSVTLPGDTIVGQSPRLAPLGSNGGQIAGSPGHPLTRSVPTHLLFVGSPAIDTGLNPENFAYEQRGAGFPRLRGPAPDIGATEGSISPDLPVPALGPWLVAALSALLGVLGLASRRRRGA